MTWTGSDQVQAEAAWLEWISEYLRRPAPDLSAGATKEAFIAGARWADDLRGDG